MFNINKKLEFEIVIVGGGPAGIMAAVSASRQGVKVALIESNNCLGGSRTATAVDTFYGFHLREKPQKRIVGGISWETIEELEKRNACYYRQNTYGAGIGITYDVEVLKCVWDTMAVEANVHLLLHTKMCHVNVENKKVKSIVVANKWGMTEISAKRFIDTSGDGDLAFFAGAETIPLMDGETLQSLTTIFFMGNVDIDLANSVSRKDFEDIAKSCVELKKYNLTRLDGSYHKTVHPGIIQANMTRIINVDATDAEQITKAEIEGRKQAQEYARFLKDNIKGYNKAFLLSTGQYVGVRETRKIIGEYVLTEEDVVSANKFDDGIVLCGAPVEDHHSGRGTKWVYVKGDGCYSIPYRCLVPKNLNNIIVAGRCASLNHGAQASARNTAQVMGMGEAAGLAAVQSLNNNITFSDISVQELLDDLKSQNAILKI